MDRTGQKGILALPLTAVICAAFTGSGFAASAADPGKTGNMSILYGVLFGLSFLLLVGYCLHVKKKTAWFILLYAAVFVANGGYFALSVAGGLEEAMLANQCAYFGSAMLPLAMLMIIVQTCRIRCPRWTVTALVMISVAAFLLAASGSEFGLYYREVSVVEINGMTCLQKVYGPLHFLYTVYLFVYFAMMLAVIAYAAQKKIITSCKYVIFLAFSVFGNLVVWFVEQLIHVNFEFLAVSYIVSEVSLLLVHSILQDYDRLAAGVRRGTQGIAEGEAAQMPPDMEELFDTFSARAAGLTATERMILRHYADGRSVAEAAELSFISINTIRKHNANIYRKLGVGARDELVLYIELFRRCGRLDEILQAPGEPAN